MTDPVVYPSSPPTDLPAPPTAPPPLVEQARSAARIGTRVGEVLLEFVLIGCTFGFGWVGWWIVSWADGQSPAKVVLHLHVVHMDDGRLVSFGRMALREVVGKAIPGVGALGGIYFAQRSLLVLAGAYLAINAVVALSDPFRRTLWDRLAKTVVLDGDPPPMFTPPAEADTALV